MTLSLATAGEFTTFKNDQGIDLFFDYTAEVMSNVSGGDHTGTGYNGLASFGVEADLGQALGCGAHLAGLRRTVSGKFNVGDATQLEELTTLSPDDLAKRVVPMLQLSAATES